MNRTALTWSSGYSVITGAGSGFGRALALELGRRGSRLVLSDINRDSVEESARMCREAGAPAPKALVCDVRDLAQVEALVAACDGPINLVANNAGVSSSGRIGELPIAEWRWTIDIDLFGVIHGCHAFVPVLRKQGFGHVLNVASAAGFLSGDRMGPYCVSKAGVVALSECLASELVDTGVGVTVLCPTFFRTNIVEAGHHTDEDTRELGRFAISRGRSVEMVVQAALEAVERNELYCVPMFGGRMLWRLKRVAPETFSTVMARSQPFIRRMALRAAKKGKQGA
jgi:NAD(P)-dependent dehydrogenase (short-subunit alcohol dehydrogenase family)